MVRVSRDTEEASAFRVVVAVGAESMAQPRNAAKKILTLSLYTQRRIAGMGERAGRWQQVFESKGVGGSQGGRQLRRNRPLDNSRYNEYCCLSTLEVGHDQHPQEPRTRSRQSRLAEHPFHLFLCRLLRREARAFPHAARHER